MCSGSLATLVTSTLPSCSRVSCLTGFCAASGAAETEGTCEESKSGRVMHVMAHRTACPMDDQRLALCIFMREGSLLKNRWHRLRIPALDHSLLQQLAGSDASRVD